MSITTDILAFTQQFSGVALDDPPLRHDLDDCILNLDPLELLVAVTLVEHDDDNSTYRVPEPGIRILATWYDDRQLAYAAPSGLEAVTPLWRDRDGTPSSWTMDTEGDRMFRLFPKPDASSKDFSFAFGLPYGRDFPAYAVAVAYTEARDHLPDWLDLPLALATLAKHYAREERSRDATFAATCRRLADQLLAMVA